MMTAEESLARARSIVQSIVAERQDRPSLVYGIACDVGAEIIEGIILAGHDLNSVELSRRYQTSRTPIREALMLLEKEGLVDIPPRRRPRVVTHNIAEVREIYRTRAALLEFIAADVAQFASEGDIATLQLMIDEMESAEKAHDVSGYMWANVNFHDQNTRISRNRTVKRIIDSLLLRTLRLRRFSLSQPMRLHESLEDHRRLVKAYSDRDPNLAAALLRSNHITALERLERFMSTGVDGESKGRERGRASDKDKFAQDADVRLAAI